MRFDLQLDVALWLANRVLNEFSFMPMPCFSFDGVVIAAWHTTHLVRHFAAWGIGLMCYTKSLMPIQIKLAIATCQTLAA